jgi:flagellar hook protein FlgE
MNLDGTSTTGDTYSTTVTVYDSLGNDITLTMNFEKTANAGEWNVTASIPSTAGSGAAVSVSTVTFDADGNLTGTTDPTITLTLTNGATSPQTITWDLYEDGTTNEALTGYSTPSIVNSKPQNGYTAGTLKGFTFDSDGVITAEYSNGVLTPIYQVALADFPSYSGLTKLGGNLYAESLASGQPSIGTANSGSMGSISPRSLEMSNVDLATQFVNMITTQRAFQANSKVITTSDELLTDLINIKR